MGSPCSPALAIALCMHAEDAFMAAHPGVKVHAGFRYVDDLLLFLEHNAHDSLIDNIYPSPLELERETTTPVNGRVCFRFLETWNVLDASGSISVIHHHKNSHQLRLGKPPFKNVVDFSSHIPRHQKFGRVVGALIAAHAHTVSDADRCRAPRHASHSSVGGPVAGTRNYLSRYGHSDLGSVPLVCCAS